MEAKVIQFRTINRCDRCEHEGDLACRALRDEVRAAVAEYNGRMARHSVKTPAGAEVTLSCAAFWRKGRSHGKGGTA